MSGVFSEILNVFLHISLLKTPIYQRRIFALSNANLLQVVAYLRNLEPSANGTVLPEMQDFHKLAISNM